MPMPGVGGCNDLRCDQIEIFRILCSAARPVHRAGECDLIVDDHGFRVGDPNALIYPDWNSGMSSGLIPLLRSQGVVRSAISLTSTPRCFARTNASTVLEFVVMP